MNQGILNNREIASLIWTVIAVAWVVWRVDRPKIMGSLKSVLRALASPVILVPLLAYLVVLAGAILLAESVGLWTPELVKSTIFWILLTGVGLYFSFPRALTGEPILARILTSSGLAIVIFEVVVNFVSFPLVIELLTVPLLGMAVLITGYAEYRPVDERALGCLNAVLATYGFVALGWTGWVIVRDWNMVNPGILWREAVLPIWLTLAAGPCVYFLAIFAYYESAFHRIDWAAKGRSARRQKAALVSVGGLRLSRLRSINGLHHMDLAAHPGFRDARTYLRSQLGS